MLWIGIPVGGLWALSRVTESCNQHFVLALIAVPAAMALFAPALFWLNGLYLRVIGALRPEDDEDRRWRVRRAAGALPLRIGWRSPSRRCSSGLFFFGERPPDTVW